MIPRLPKIIPQAAIPQTRRWRLILGLSICVVAYVVLLLAYFTDGRSGAFEGVTDQEPPPGGVLVSIDFNGIDPQGRVLTATVGVDLANSLQDQSALIGQMVAPAHRLTVVIAPTADGASLTYPAGQPMTLKQLRIPTEPDSGYVRDWPFDQYRTSLVTSPGRTGTVHCRLTCPLTVRCRAGT